MDYGVYHQKIVDLNSDGGKELLFVVNCGFSYVNRKLCLVDLATHEVKLSPVAATTLSRNLSVFDIDGDGQKEVMGELLSSGNTQLSYPYCDQYAWFQIYNSDLSFTFEPEKVGNCPARFTILPLIANDKRYLAAFFNHTGNTDTSFLALYNVQGELIRKKKLEYEDGFSSANVYTGKKLHEKWLLAYNNGKVYEVDTLLNQKLLYRNHSYRDVTHWNMDMDGDGKPERIFMGKNGNEFIIVRDDFSHSIKAGFEHSFKRYFFSVQHEKGLPPKLALCTHGKMYKYLYAKNGWYYWQWPLRLFLLVSLFGAVWLLAFVQKRLISRKIESEKRIAALQIKSIRNQITPHFTLNVLNSIGALYVSNRRDEADRALGKYAKLLRQALLSSDSIAIPLSEEMDFLQNYLELEKVRMNGQLNYIIEVDDSISTEVLVPKMMLHTFVENAIKHGLKPLPESIPGQLHIHITSLKNQLRITIEDNGVGRLMAGQSKTFSTGKGLKILDEILALYRQLEKRTISYDIHDAITYDSGTRVTINLSLN